MASEVRAFTLSIPAGTPASAPVRLDCTFPPREVEALQIIVPPGPSGLVGWHILNSGVIAIPYGSDQWIITAGENITWPLQDQINSGSWQVEGYNTGTVTHNVYFRFLLKQITTPVVGASPMIDDSAISPTDTITFDEPEVMAP